MKLAFNIEWDKVLVLDLPSAKKLMEILDTAQVYNRDGYGDDAVYTRMPKRNPELRLVREDQLRESVEELSIQEEA